MDGAETFHELIETSLKKLEKEIDDCRQRLIAELAKDKGITIEEATQIADDISAKATDLILPNLPFKVEYPL